MEVITRGDVTCVTLLWQRGPGWVLTFVCKAAFELKPGEAALASDPAAPSDQDIPGEAPFSRSLAAINDLVPVKPNVDVFVTGHAHAPGGVPVRSLRARLVVGPIDKAIDVVADRYFDRDGLLVEGAPFVRMPLAYELAAGGPGTWNSAGLKVGSLDGLGHLALPNLVPAGLPAPAPDAPFVPPVGFGPIPPDWPSRVEKLGRRSLHDLPPHWHGAELPEDFPRAYFNAAPEDQQLDAAPENLTLTLENLIAGHPVLTCWLPPITPSILCEGALGTSSVRAALDTVHIDTDAARCTVVWRGHLPRRDASDDLRVLVTLENPRVRLRTSLGTTGEHPRVAPPPLPPSPAPATEPPTFSRVTGYDGAPGRASAPSAPNPAEHPRVGPPPLPATPPEPPPSPRAPFPTSPLMDAELEDSDWFAPVAAPAPIPDRKSEPTRLFTQTEAPRAIPPDRRSAQTALYPASEAPRAVSPERSQTTAFPAIATPRPPPPDRKSAQTALYPMGEPPPLPERTSQPTPVHETSPAVLARLTEIEADPEPPSEPDPYEEMGITSRDTIAPGLIHPVALPFPIPVPRPTPESSPDWGSTSLAKTGMYPWGVGTEPGRNAPPIPPDSAPPAPAPAQMPAAPVSRPARSGHTLPPAPMPAMDLPLGAELRPPPVSAALRSEVSVPAAPPMPAPVAESASPGPGDTPWGTGPSGPRRETIGMALRSGALALAEPRHEAGVAVEPAPEPEPVRSPTLLLWFDPDSVVRIRRAPQWRALLDELEKVPLDRDLESEGGPREPWELEDRRDVFELSARGRGATGRGCEEALSGARSKTGKVVPPIVLVEGEVEIQLDELESLKAAATAAAPLVTPMDEGLRSALEATDTFLRRPGLSATPAVCEGLMMRLRDAFAREKRTFSADYLDTQVERALLTGRCYQRRDVFGGPYFRALLRVTGEKEPLVTYLPEAVHKRVPMFRRFAARVIVDVHPQQDPYETRPLALRVLALARTT